MGPGYAAALGERGVADLTIHEMSTRKLIGLALACAVAILMAGGVQLIILANRDNPTLDRDAVLSVGESAGDRTVAEVRVDGTDVVAVVVDASGAAVNPDDVTVFSDTGDDVRRGESSCEQDRCSLVVPGGAAQLADLLLVWEADGARNLWALAPGSD